MDELEDGNPWKVLNEETAYDCRYFSVRHDRVTLAEGEPRSYHSVRMKYYGVCVVPVDHDGGLTLIGQYRYVLNRFSWEIPGGGARVGDDPLAVARAELKEETGCTAAHWLKIVEGAVSPGISTEAVPAFVAWGLDRGAPQPDATELLSRRRVSFADAVNMALAGEISNLPGIAALLAMEVRRRRRDLPDSLLALLK
jgi:8-oxo-dGTP pyrophosphatase MutT (NUDIX family)